MSMLDKIDRMITDIQNKKMSEEKYYQGAIDSLLLLKQELTQTNGKEAENNQPESLSEAKKARASKDSAASS